MPDFPDDSFPYAVTRADIANARRVAAPPVNRLAFVWFITAVLLVALFLYLKAANKTTHAAPIPPPTAGSTHNSGDRFITFSIFALAISSFALGVIGLLRTRRAHPEYFRTTPKEPERFAPSPQGLFFRWPHRTLFIPWQRFNAFHETENLFVLTNTKTPQSPTVLPLREVPPHRIDELRRLIQSELEKGKP